MTKFLMRVFLAGAEERSPQYRERCGVLAGVVGLVSNLLLFAAKLLVGLLTGSIAVTADAINNLSDCGSSVITLVGFKLSGQPADEKHPWGHARFEYISGLVISIIIIFIGLEFFVSAVQRIVNPQPVSFSAVSIVVLSASILVKLWQARFFRSTGNAINSDALLASAVDSRNDVGATIAVLGGALVSRVINFPPLDGCIGVAIAVFIVVSGIKLVGVMLTPLLGAAPEPALVKKIEARILAYEDVIGLHDLMVHSYGPERRFASVHVEFPAQADLLACHDVIDRIERDFERELGVSLVVHLDPVVTDDPQTNLLRAEAEKAAKAVDAALSTHDFRMVRGKSHQNLIFDVVVPPRFRLSDKELCARIAAHMAAIDAGCHCVIRVDRNYTSTVHK